MSYTFRVVFDGVLSYVPDKPFFCERRNDKWKAQKDVRSLSVLLPDLRRPGESKRPPEDCCCGSKVKSRDRSDGSIFLPKFRDPHFPLLKFRLSDLRDGTTRRVDLVCRDISEREEEGVLLLRRERVSFSLKAENDRSFSFADWIPPPNRARPRRDQFEDETARSEVESCVENIGGIDRCRPSHDVPNLGLREELESLWWLPDLAQIVGEKYKNAARVDEKFLDSYRGPFPEGLIARVECDGGRLRTYDFNRGVDGAPIAWRFAAPTDSDPKSGTWKRAIGNSLALEFYDVRGPVRIGLRKLANEVIDRTLVLAPAPGAARPIVEIEISNREPDLLFSDEGFSRSTLPDMDFQAFYERLSQADKETIHELPVPHPSGSSFFGVVEKPCAGACMVQNRPTI